MGWRVGVLTEPFAVGAHAVRRLGPRVKGGRVVVLGGGSIGLATAACAVHAGVGKLVVVDKSEANLSLAVEMGAVPVLAGPKMGEEVRRGLGGPAEGIVITSDYKGVFDHALALAGAGGRVVVVALFGDQPVLDTSLVVLGEREVVGSVLYTKADFEVALEVLGAKQSVFDKMITHVYPLEATSRAFEVLEGREGNPIKVIIECDSSFGLS